MSVVKFPRMSITEQLELYARRMNWVDEDVEFMMKLLGEAYEDGYNEGYADAME